MKTRKKVQSNKVTNAIDTNAINATKYTCAMFEENIVQDKIVTIDMSRVNKIDYLKMSRIDMFRKAIKLFLTFDQLAVYDFKFYRDTNDRSKTKSLDKQTDLMNYCKNNRTAKQLRDVLKEQNTIDFYAKHNMKVESVTQYKSLITVALQVSK